MLTNSFAQEPWWNCLYDTTSRV